MKKILCLLLFLLPLQAGCTQMLDQANAEGAEADMKQLLVQHGVEVTQIHCEMVPQGSRNFTCHFSVKQYLKGTPNAPKPTGTLNTTMKLRTYSTKTFLSNRDDTPDKKEFIRQCYPFRDTLAEFDGKVLGTTMPRQPEINRFEYLFIHFIPYGSGCLISSYSFS